MSTTIWPFMFLELHENWALDVSMVILDGGSPVS